MNEAQALAVTPQNHDQPAALQVVPTASSAVVLDRANLQFMSDMITAADLIPPDKNVSRDVQKFRVMAKIVAGVAHDFDPISSQENLHIIQGRCVLSARGMAIKLRRTGRYDTRVEKLDNDVCRLAVLEKNDEGKWILKGHVEFSRADADKAKLTTSNAAMYEKWGVDMLYANAIKRVCRRFAPEVLDTKPVLYDTARRPELPSSPEPLPDIPQITAPQGNPAESVQSEPDINNTVEVGQEYTDAEYNGASIADVIDVDLDDSFTPAKGEVVIDTAESKHADLLTAAKELYADLPKDAKKKADQWLGQRVIKDLSTEELGEFLSSFQE